MYSRPVDRAGRARPVLHAARTTSMKKACNVMPRAVAAAATCCLIDSVTRTDRLAIRPF
jgi:hypothetical protein